MRSAPAAGRALLEAIKARAGAPGPSLVIPVGSPPVALLRPLATRAEYLRPADVRALTDWRNKFVRAFLTEFTATEDRTRGWLSSVVAGNPGKILFMVDDPSGKTFAYMGLDFIDWDERYGEADAIVRGDDAPPGLMKLALTTLLDFATGALGLEALGVRVRSDNTALTFYEKVGFRETKRVPLRRVDEPGLVRWVEDGNLADSPVHLVHLSYSR